MRRAIFLVVFLVTAGSIHAQILARTVYSCSGSSFENQGYYLSFTIGQPAFSTFLNENNAISEGFQQPHVHVKPESGRFIEVFPNPVFTKLTVQISVKEQTDITLEIFSVSGVRLKKTVIEDLQSFTEYPLDFTYLPQGIYLLHVYSVSDRNLDSLFKIEKL